MTKPFSPLEVVGRVKELVGKAVNRLSLAGDEADGLAAHRRPEI